MPGPGSYQRAQHHAVELVPTHPRAMHLFDDADDDERFALVVIEGLADELVLLLGEHGFGERARDHGRAGETLRVLRPKFDIGGGEVPAVGELHTQRLHGVIVGVVVRHRRFLALLVGQ